MQTPDNPYSSGSSALAEDADKDGPFEPLLLAPSLSLASVSASLNCILAACYALWALYACAWLHSQMSRMPSAVSRRDAALIIGFQIVPCLIAVGIFGYGALRTWRYRKAVQQLIVGLISWRQFALLHNSFWRATVLLHVFSFVYTVALWFIGWITTAS